MRSNLIRVQVYLEYHDGKGLGTPQFHSVNVARRVK